MKNFENRLPQKGISIKQNLNKLRICRIIKSGNTAMRRSNNQEFYKIFQNVTHVPKKTKTTLSTIKEEPEISVLELQMHQKTQRVQKKTRNR